jgi:hypothetical protein
MIVDWWLVIDDFPRSIFVSIVGESRIRFSFCASSGWCKLPRMLFMVIEHFKPGSTVKVGERFRQSGRMLPEGVTYHASWVDLTGARCFQIMEAASPELLQTWVRHWNDLVEFEIVPVQTSAEFWNSR